MPTDGGESSAHETTVLLPETPPHDAPKVLRGLLAAVFLFVTAIAMTVPVRPRLILDAAHGDASFASYFQGAVDSLQAFVIIFSSPLFGAVSDVIGRKPIIILSHLGEFIGLFVVATFPKSLTAQFPAYILIALTNAYVTTANTIIADISHADVTTSARNYGYLGAMFGFCFLIGPTLGGVTEDSFYLASSLHVACFLILIAMIFVYFFLPETKSSNNDDQPVTPTQVVEAIRDTNLNPIPRVRGIFAQSEALTWIAITIAVSSLAQSGLNSIVFLYVNVRLGWGTKETGFFLSMVGLSLLISQAILAPASVHIIGEVPTILLGYSLAALHYVIYGLARSSMTMYVGLLVGMFSFIAEPAMKGVLARQVPRNVQGSLQGSVSALTAVIRPLAPILSAAFFGVGNSMGRPGLPFFVIGFISALSVACARVAFWKPGLK